MLPFINRCFLLFPLGFMAGTFYRMNVLSHQDKTIGKEGFFWSAALAAVEQAICIIIIGGILGNAGNRLF